MTTTRRSPGARGVLGALLVGLFSLIIAVLVPYTSAGAAEPPEGQEATEQLHYEPAPEEPPPPDVGPAPGANEPEPPPTDTVPPAEDSGGQPTPEEMSEVQATVESVVEEVAAAPENDAQQRFLVAVFRKVADLQNRYGNVVGPGDKVPTSVLDAIQNELRAFLEPFAKQVCDGKLQLAGISAEVERRLRIKSWMYFVPPVLLVFVIFRKGVCVSRLLEAATTQLLPPCPIARGHDAMLWFWEVGGYFGEGPFPTREAAMNRLGAYILEHGLNIPPPKPLDPNPTPMIRIYETGPHCVHD